VEEHPCTSAASAGFSGFTETEGESLSDELRRVRRVTPCHGSVMQKSCIGYHEGTPFFALPRLSSSPGSPDDATTADALRPSSAESVARRTRTRAV